MGGLDAERNQLSEGTGKSAHCRNNLILFPAASVGPWLYY